MTRKVGFHVHTNFSDGKLPLEEVVDYGINGEYDKLAITDHDTFRAFDVNLIQEEVQPHLKESFNKELKPKSRAVLNIPYTSQKGEEKDLELIQGIELTTKYQKKELEDEIHITGLYINPPDDEFRTYLGDIGNTKDSVRRLREERFIIMTKRLNSVFGTELNEDKIIREHVTRGVPTRLHLAYALRLDFLNRGLDSELVKDILKRFNLGNEIPSVHTILDTILGKNSPVYEKFELGRVISSEQAIRKIIELQGIPVWAHPWKSKKRDFKFLESMLEDFIKYSDGKVALEFVHKDVVEKKYHEAIDFCKKLRKKYHLILVPSHDFHGRPYYEGQTLGKKYPNHKIERIERAYKKIENTYRAITR
jgi:predicted metal-dependent phosphoesterase TrpH